MRKPMCASRELSWAATLAFLLLPRNASRSNSGRPTHGSRRRRTARAPGVGRVARVLDFFLDPKPLASLAPWRFSLPARTRREARLDAAKGGGSGDAGNAEGKGGGAQIAAELLGRR